MERLLCIKIASRGDLLLAGPAFRRLREARPTAHITLLVGASCDGVARHIPFFDEIQVVNDHALLAGRMCARAREAGRLMMWMKQSKSEEVFIFHRDWRYGPLAWLAGIPIRRGFDSGSWSGLLTHAYSAGEKEHHVSQYLGIVGFGKVSETPIEGVWKFHDDERELNLAAAALHGFRTESAKWIALGFGGGHNVKTQTKLKLWPIQHYRDLASRLEQKGFRAAWVGDAHDATLLASPFAGVNLAGKLSVSETAAVLSACRATVSNDTMMLHLSEALGVPSVGIFGPSEPAHYRPLGKNSTYIWYGKDLPCSPCYRVGGFPPCAYQHRCMTDLSVESVLERVEAAQ